MDDLVSVIVPVYKVEDYIGRCVDSIINQTYKNLEIILVDDGSPDKCPQICDEYERNDARVKVIHKENGGAAQARNAALKIITGKYITFVDSDDFLDIQAIEKWKSLCDEFEADLVVGNFCNYYSDADILYSHDGVNEVYTSEMMMRKMLVEQFEICAPWGKLYKASLFEEIEYPEDLKIAEDMAVIHKILLRCGRIVYDENKYYYYNKVNVSLVRSRFEIIKLKRIDVAKEWLDCVDQNYPNIHNEAFATYMTILINECTYLLDNREWRGFLKTCIAIIKGDYGELKKNPYIRCQDKAKAFLLKNNLVGLYRLIRKVCARA